MERHFETNEHLDMEPDPILPRRLGRLGPNQSFSPSSMPWLQPSYGVNRDDSKPSSATGVRKSTRDARAESLLPSKKRKHSKATTSPSVDDQLKIVDKTWDDHFDDLVSFRKSYGQANITHKRDDLRALSRWVREQLKEYKNKLSRKSSSMSDERFQKLNSIGFIWNNQCVYWEEKFLALCDFQKQFQHCNVPRRYQPDPKLSTFVKQQRRLYRDQSINPHHKSKLESIGFEWGVHIFSRRAPDEGTDNYDFDDC